MNKFYYFSENKLKYIEIKNFPKKFVGLLIVLVILTSSLLFGGYFLISSFSDSESQLSSLKKTNKQLSNKLNDLVSIFETLEYRLDSLSDVHNELRIAANLPPLSMEERTLGVGGGIFEDFFKTNTEISLDDISSYVDQISNKISFEKNNFETISEKLKSNEQLYESIPAIKPSPGAFALHGFGMRRHPILGITRMHEGIDIIADIGSPVKSPGSGRIEFLGKRGGLGLCIEIDHGFGYRTIYGHLSSVNVKIGQKIKRGQLIAKTGNSGLSTGPHLHYEVHHNGIKLDPMDFVFDDLNLFDHQQ